ncbi:MAG: hypothetical protein KBB83_06900 [Alphaproteobacteria bacterium]|nr:hypothetical protein [Alphaproteobacteria bacterium]
MKKKIITSSFFFLFISHAHAHLALDCLKNIDRRMDEVKTSKNIDSTHKESMLNQLHDFKLKQNYINSLNKIPSQQENAKEIALKLEKDYIHFEKKLVSFKKKSKKNKK